MNATPSTPPGPSDSADTGTEISPTPPPSEPDPASTRASAPRAKDNLALSFRLCTGEGLVAMPLVIMTMPVNVVLSALFTKALHLPNQTIGFISALPFVCNFLQVGVTPLLSRWFPAKVITLTAASFQVLSWVFFCILIGFLPADDPARAGLWIGVWFFFSSFCSSITGVTWNAWVQEWVPARLRGKYFGRRNRLLQFSTLSFFLLAGWVLAAWDYSRIAFQLLIAFAVLLRVLSILWSLRMPTEASASPPSRSATLSAQFVTLRRSSAFIRFVVFGAVWSFTANLFGPFYHVFMFDQLQLSALSVGLLAVCGASGAALSMPAWGRLLDVFGNKGVMVVSLVLWQTQNIGWSFLTPENSNWLYAMWLWGGLTNAGFFLGQFTLMLKLLPLPARSLALGLNLAITSLFAAMAPVLGGLILEWGGSRWATLDVYHACFLAQPLLSLVVAWLLLRIREPAASPLTHVVGAMRNVRTIASLSGLSFFAQHFFYRNAKRPD